MVNEAALPINLFGFQVWSEKRSQKENHKVNRIWREIIRERWRDNSVWQIRTEARLA